MVSLGGNPASGKYDDQYGSQAVRMFTPLRRTKLPSLREPYSHSPHFPSVVPIFSADARRVAFRFVLGGMTSNGWNGKDSTANPTYEWFPPKGNGLAIFSRFLHDALRANLFPITFLMPSGQLFVAANLLAMIFDPTTK